MKRHLERRRFLSVSARGLIASLWIPALACSPRDVQEDGKREEASAGSTAPDNMKAFAGKLEEMRKMPRELVEQLLHQKASEYMQRAHHCAQSSFLVLRDQFGLPGGEIVKALTPLPGIAERGATCGAVTGPLLALGLIYGRDEGQLNDWEAYQRSLDPAGRFCEAFEEAFGSLDCHGVQEGAFGRCYRLTDPAELAQFQHDGATEGCTEVVSKAVSLAASIILDDPTL